LGNPEEAVASTRLEPADSDNPTADQPAIPANWRRESPLLAIRQCLALRR
jgi:hypothetical protein